MYEVHDTCNQCLIQSQNSFTDSVISLVHLNCSFAQWTGQEVWPWPWGSVLSKRLILQRFILSDPLWSPPCALKLTGSWRMFWGCLYCEDFSSQSPSWAPKSTQFWRAIWCILRNDVFPAPHLIWTPFHALKLTASWIACRLFLCCVLTSSPHWPASYLGPRKNNTIYY